MKCIMGLVQADAGDVYLEADGQRIDCGQAPPKPLSTWGSPWCLKAAACFPSSRWKKIYAWAPTERPHGEPSTPTCVSLRGLPILAQRRRQLAGSMSGGEQQMLAMLAPRVRPKILLVDEPSVGLAPILVSHVIAKIKELKEQYHLTVLMAEQNFHQAVKIADRGYIIVHGRIAFEGRNTQELSENDLVKQYYLGLNLSLSRRL